ncbi:hypothetical protein NOCARDAX2BIS_210056 [Nocardioides sp. AX2bis]|nr:hypothetical protein NOCARDAX2BIS_210056 [Nocardioides sp. AX2bis]
MRRGAPPRRRRRRHPAVPWLAVGPDGAARLLGSRTRDHPYDPHHLHHRTARHPHHLHHRTARHPHHPSRRTRGDHTTRRSP